MADYKVNGLDLFAEKFKDYTDNFIIVGGTACSLAMTDVGIDFRATNDIDMIVIVEELSIAFGKQFWEFIKAGGYEIWKSEEQTHFFRFIEPKIASYPKMIELFSRNQDWVPEDMVGKYTKLVVGDEISSLSAILLDDTYYQFLKSGSEIVNDLPILKPVYLIAFKAKAHVDLTRKHNEGKHINERDLKKHKNDIFRLVQLLDPEERIDISDSVKEDLQQFFALIENEKIDMKALHLNYAKEDAIRIIKQVFQMD